MLGARMLLNGRGDGDALGNDQRHGIDSDRDGSAAVLHSRGIARRYRSGTEGQGGVHCAGCEGIAIHGFGNLAVALMAVGQRRVGAVEERGLPARTKERNGNQPTRNIRNVSLGQAKVSSFEGSRLENRQRNRHGASTSSR